METIHQLIAAGKLDKALEILKNIDPSNEITMLQGRLNRLKRNSRMNVISGDNANIERNRITAAILDLASYMDIPEDIPMPTPPQSEITPQSEEAYRGGGRIDKTPRPPKVPYENDGQPLFNGEEKTRILFLSANPIGESHLQIGFENSKIITEIRAGEYRDKFELLHPQLAVTNLNLLTAMNQAPHIIHFSGHGIQKGIIIATQNNQRQIIKTKTLVRVFKKVKDTARCVLLNSCYSAEQAKAISEIGMFVIGYNTPVADPAAISFAKGFYNGLVAGNSFQESFEDGLIIWETESNQSTDIIEVWKDGQLLDL